MVGAAEETFGGLDFLVNNAGLTADRLSTPGRFSPSRRAVEGAP
jgi:NAD(P)-dependent dehydrogenase (short-subunit alcohol dehydrogenase family)